MCRLQRGRSSRLLAFGCKAVGPQRASLAAGGQAGPSWAAGLGHGQESPVKTWLLFPRLPPSSCKIPRSLSSAARATGVSGPGAKKPGALPHRLETRTLAGRGGPAAAAISKDHYSSQGSLSLGLDLTGRGGKATSSPSSLTKEPAYFKALSEQYRILRYQITITAQGGGLINLCYA